MSTLREAAQQLLEAWSRRDYEIGKYMDALRAALAKEAEPTYTTGHCKEKAKAGGCPLHNLQCGYPECDRKPAAQQAEPDAKAYATRLAVAIWRKHYRQIAPQWKPLDDLIGVLSQIDNMTAGMQLTQQAEPSRTQRMRDAGYTRRPTAREMVEKDEPVRELLISAAAMAVVAERKGEYKGASWVADAILETVPFSSQASQQAEPTQAPCDIAEDGVCEVIDCCRNPKQAEPVAWVLPDLLPVFSFKTAQLWKRPFAEDQIPLYTAPPQRKPLTEEEIYEMYSEPSSDAEMVEFARAIERAHGIGGYDEQV